MMAGALEPAGRGGVGLPLVLQHLKRRNRRTKSGKNRSRR